MKKLMFTGVLALSLTACQDTNPLTDGGGGGGGGATNQNDIPAVLAANVTGVSYDGASTLTVDVSALDIGDRTISYVRNPALDVPGYVGFSYQDDPLDRFFVALVAQSGSGDLTAAVVADGGQFNTYYYGGYYSRDSDVNLPTTGQVSYAGTYAGITNIDSPGGHLLPPDPGTPGEVLPSEPALTQGSVFLNVNFEDMAVSGVIYDRSFIDAGYGTLPSLALQPADIDASGQFLSSVEFDGRPDEGTQGSYGGIFGGPTGYDEVAGIVYLTNIFLSDDVRDTDFDAEVGVFVLPRCGTAGAPPICDQVN